jgi:hypothetical protein
MALSNVVFNRSDGVLTIEDGSPSAIVLTGAYMEGDLSIGAMGQANNAEIHTPFDRNEMMIPRLGRESSVDFSFTAHATEFADATEKTWFDLAFGTGAFSGGVSQYGAGDGIPWATKLTWTGTSSGDTSTVVADYVTISVAFTEGDLGKFTISGTARFLDGTGITLT